MDFDFKKRLEFDYKNHPDFIYLHQLPLSKIKLKQKKNSLVKIFSKLFKLQNEKLLPSQIKQNVLDYCKNMNYNTKNEFLNLFKTNFNHPQFKFNVFLLDILLKIYKFNCIVFSNNSINVIKINDNNSIPFILLFYSKNDNQYYLTSFNKNYMFSSLYNELSLLDDSNLFIEYHFKNFIDNYYSKTLLDYHIFINTVLIYLQNQVIPSTIHMSKKDLLLRFVECFYNNYPSISIESYKINSIEKSIENSIQNSIEKSIRNSIDNSIQNSIDNSIQNSIDNSIDNSIEKSIEKINENSFEKLINNSNNSVVNKEKEFKDNKHRIVNDDSIGIFKLETSEDGI